MRYFYKCLRENFKSPLTYAAIVIFSILCIFGMSFSENDTVYTFFDVLSNEKLFETVKLNINYSSYLLAFKFSDFNWYTVGLTVLTAIPALYTYVKSLEKVRKLWKRAELGFWKRSRVIQNSLRAVKAFRCLFTAEKINIPRAAVMLPFSYNSWSKTAQNKTDFTA